MKGKVKRVEVQDLKPGDRFEYENPMRHANKRLERDQVRPRGITTKNGARIFRADVTSHFIDGTSEVSAITIYTEIGMSNHGYVRLPPNEVVLLLEGQD